MQNCYTDKTINTMYKLKLVLINTINLDYKYTFYFRYIIIKRI